MLDKFQHHLDTSLPFLKDKKLFLAVSGGLDSMVLVYLMHQLNFKIAVLHCNFNLRNSESDGDEDFVKLICNQLKIPVYVQKNDTLTFAATHKLSIQVAARNLRYAWFDEQLKLKKFDFVLTAHHLDDSFETFLINFSRGTGIEGLLGIPQQYNNIIRPLLPFSRAAILDFAQTNLINWREDSSNSTSKYLRNKLRLDVIPILKDMQPNLLSNFATTLKNLNQIQSLAEEASKTAYLNVVTEQGDTIEIDLEKLVQLPNYQAYLYQWLKKFDFTSWQDIYQLVTAESGKKVLSNEYVLLKNRATLTVYKKEESTKNEIICINENQNQVKYPLNLDFSDATSLLITDSSTIFVDKSKLLFPLTIRKFKSEDLFYPFGFEGKMKITTFFKNSKLSTIEKKNTWLLCSNDQIVWVINHRLDNRFKVSESTTSILKITIA